MANCEPCNRDNHSVAAIGYCQEASHRKNFWVCVHPNRGRPDRRFHGERCGCGCGDLFCRPHARSHARTHGGGAVGCFPNFSFATAGTAFGGAAARLGDVALRSPEEEDSRADMTALLVDIEPGREALDSALRAEGLDGLGQPGSEEWVHVARLPAEFFVPPRLVCTALIAARVLGRTVGRIADGVEVSAGMRKGISHFEALDDLRQWPESGHTPTARVLVGALWSGSSSVDWEAAARTIQEGMRRGELPENNEELALWLIRGGEADHTPPTVAAGAW